MLQAREGVLERIFGIIILLLVAMTVWNRDFGLVSGAARSSRFAASVCAFPLGFYETFFGSGNGMFSSAMLIKTRGLILTTALGYYYIASFAWCCLGSYLYINNGFRDMSLIVPSSIGSLAGAYLGSMLGRQRGPTFVRKLFLALGTLMGLKLLIG